MSDLEEMEEIADQTTFRVNEGHPKMGPKQGRVSKIGNCSRAINVFAVAKRIKRKPVTLPDRA